MRKTYIFTEAYKETGLGHLRRCTALAEILQPVSNTVCIVLDSDLEVEVPAIPVAHVKWKDIDNLNAFVEANCIETAFIDSYLASFQVYDQVMQSAGDLVCLDDTNRIDYPHGARILNPGFGGLFLNYPVRYNQVLTGVEYVLLREAFREDFQPRPLSPEVKTILLTTGGSDNLGLVPIILQILVEKYPRAEKWVIAGPAFSNRSMISKACDKKTKIFESLSAHDIRNIMLQADFAVTAGGQTTYELAKCGVPMVVVQTAENQAGNIRGFLHNNCILFAGDPADENFEKELYAKLIEIANWELRNKLCDACLEIMQLNQPENIRVLLRRAA